MPDLVALQDHYRDQLVVVGLSIDEGPLAEVRDFVKEFSVNYPVAVVGEPVVRAFGGVQAVPATFVVDREGKSCSATSGGFRWSGRNTKSARLPACRPAPRSSGFRIRARCCSPTPRTRRRFPASTSSHHSALQKRQALSRMNVEPCSCGCGLTVAQCRIEDPTCDVSLPQARQIAEEERLRQEAPRKQ